MNNTINIKKNNIKEIKKELTINGGDLDLYLDIFITDKNGNKEKVISKKADSILANFVRMMYVQMCRDNRDNIMGTFYKLGHTFSGSNIVSLSAGAGSVFRINGTTGLFTSYPSSGKITLGGFQGITLEGRFDFTKVSSSAIDIIGTTYTTGWVSGTGGGASYFPITKIGNPYHWQFQSMGIVVGSGDAIVTIDDQMLEKQIPNTSANGGLTYGSSIVSQDTNDTTSAQITFTRTFTNNGTVTVAVKEIALLMRGGTDDVTLTVMRDLLPNIVNVASGSTLTVNYRLKTTLGTGTDSGGFVSNFMRMMYRHIGQTSRAVFDIDNVSRTHFPTVASFNVLYSGGINKLDPNSGESFEGYRLGIVVGRGNTPVSMGDYYLETPVTHGQNANQMLYYGGFAENFQVTSGYAEFSITKAIENNSGANIDINEYGLVVASDTATSLTSSSVNFNSFILVTRNVLSTPITVNNGVILKVTYTFRVLLNSSSS